VNTHGGVYCIVLKPCKLFPIYRSTSSPRGRVFRFLNIVCLDPVIIYKCTMPIQNTTVHYLDYYKRPLTIA
jgi:hypothetical protein